MEPKPDIATEILIRQFAADSMVGMQPNRSYSSSEVQHMEDTRRRAQAALQVYIDHGYKIQTPYRMANVTYVGREPPAPAPSAPQD